ncbi:hypothetical protein APX70_06460 [Pseudomonas syringae pv. maculicola]|uniref:Uncharacterized protein n=1 Tax=Pseudomonas syringae pv. maculicola TaxID=59511 RepID=A0A3M2WTA2_PSEYM|nr:hypothetical protein APX70_06460 [Pseudomonas syringae pv. maculicola]
MRGYFGKLLLIATDQHDARAFMCETLGGRFADSRTGSGDNNDFLGESIHAAAPKERMGYEVDCAVLRSVQSHSASAL